MNDLYFTNPKAPTLGGVYSTSLSSSLVLTIASGSTYLEVSAIDKGIFMKWGAVATSADFDEFISANTTRIYLIPTGQTTAQFLQESATAKIVIIEK